jgi:hypothetical protein
MVVVVSTFPFHHIGCPVTCGTLDRDRLLNTDRGAGFNEQQLALYDIIMTCELKRTNVALLNSGTIASTPEVEWIMELEKELVSTKLQLDFYRQLSRPRNAY